MTSFCGTVQHDACLAGLPPHAFSGAAGSALLQAHAYAAGPNTENEGLHRSVKVVPLSQAGGSVPGRGGFGMHAPPSGAVSTATPASSGAETMSISSTGRAAAWSASPDPAADSSNPVRRLSALLSGDEEPPAPGASPASEAAPTGESPAGAEALSGSQRAPLAEGTPFREVGNIVPAPSAGSPRKAGAPGGTAAAMGQAVSGQRSGARSGKGGVAGPAGRRLSGGGGGRRLSDPENLSPTEAAIRDGLRRSSRLRTPAKAR